jgi:16S rRNA (uracil1498-N3)-methyltransferase
MHRFFVSKECLQAKQVILTGRQAHQIRNVLRMKSGDHVIVLDNTGCEYTAILTKIGRQNVVGEVISKQQAQAEPHTRITLYQSLLTREKFEWMLQKCTEVGVTSFVPVVTERSIVRRPDAITSRKLSRWREIITEAAEQSGRGRIPQLDAAVNFADAVSRIGDFNRCLIGLPGAAGSSVREILRNGNAKPVTVALFIGPEGGFTDEEIADACSKGATAFSLGKRILRTETAAVVASAVILYELGELIP